MTPPSIERPTRRRAAAAFVAAAALQLLVTVEYAGAQTWRSVESSRQLRDSAPVAVRVDYGAGRLEVRPTDDPVLYRMELRYDAERDTPVHEFDAGSRRLDLGARTGKARFIRNDRGGEMRLELPRGVPMDLGLDVGAVRAELDLRGIALDRLKINTGASETRVRFDSAGGRGMRSIEAEAGAARLEMLDIASAGPAAVKVHVGVGGADLDFGRVWRNEIDLDVQAALGSMTLRVPREVGIRLELERALSGFEHDGLRRRGENDWVSDNWDTADRRLRIRAETALGKLRIDRF